LQTVRAEERKASLVERWPELPRPALGGKTPRAAKVIPELRIPLSAAVLILEQARGPGLLDEIFDELRQILGLSPVEPLVLPPGSGHTLPLVRAIRVDVSQISDDDLVALFRRAMLAGAEPAVVHLAREVVRRPSVADRIPPREAYRHLLSAERDAEKARELINEARAQSGSPIDLKMWDLLELELFITSGNSREATAAVERIQRQYADDPEMETAVYQLLHRLGVIRQDEAWQEEGIVDEPVAAGTPSQAEPGRIWTPESERPAGGKSTLWTPS
jgi:hypothetical protein